MFSAPQSLIVLLLFILGPFSETDQAFLRQDSPDQIIRSQRPENTAALIQSSDLVIQVHIDGRIRRWETGWKLSSGRRLVNASQKLYPVSVLKGTFSAPPLLLTTGIEPLPVPDDPLNRIYTGPLADGEYLLFLRSSAVPPFFILNGGFSGVYPIYSGSTIALDTDGFPDLGRKTMDQIAAMIRRMESRTQRFFSISVVDRPYILLKKREKIGGRNYGKIHYSHK
ncbi:hypothetical protein ABNN70_10990 [Sporolactobacillus sp. Y61]|uniref:Bypass of forespore C C-terminal domain-containing protein n=1 Tax=Sporolactobacillus sp. Y61 TaxID=3160863 RepID=A0AAU8IDB0_9BACL